MTDTTIQSLVQGNLSLPTIPEVMLKVQRIIEDPESGTRDLGELVAQDAPLAAKVLRIANSSYYGAEECVSTTHACTLLGMRVLKNLVMQVAVMDQFDHLKGTGFDIAGIWAHAVSTAHISALIASKRPVEMPCRPDEVYGCGLLHDIGKIVMLDGLGGAYVEIAGEAAAKQLPIEVLEKMKLGFDHTDVGSIVAERWGMPSEITEAIQLHHAPESEVKNRRVAAVVWCANHVAHEIEVGNPAAAAAILESEPARFLALTTAEMDEIIQFALQ